MRRRAFLKTALVGSVGVGLAATALLRPADLGRAYTPRFRAWNDWLRSHAEGKPVLIIDLERLDHNIRALQRLLRPETTLRLVEKSLPSPGLLAYLRERLNTRALMSFHLPFLQQDVVAFPDSTILLGKPLPVAAAATFYRDFRRGAFEPSQQLDWLIDTEARLREYQQLAHSLGTRLRVSLEIDVGLHRGGLPDPEALVPLLRRIQQDPDHLQFAGFMGYDAHVGRIPGVIESRATSHATAVARYSAFIGRLQVEAPEFLNRSPVFNGAGSPTIALHRDHSVCNDLAAGSCLLKPSDFDLDLLSDFLPAAFIATPVLKRHDGLQIPGVSALGSLLGAWDPNQRVAHFIYGGRWMAQPHEPAGLQANALYGASSNQMLYTGSGAQGLQPGDWVFFRPTQSESVLLPFGDLLALRGGQLEARWPVLQEVPRPIDDLTP